MSHHQHCQYHLTQPRPLSPAADRNQQSTGSSINDKSEILKRITDLAKKVDKLEDDMIDMVNRVERISNDTHHQSPPPIVSKKISDRNVPLFRNPQDIPNFDSIDVIEVNCVNG